MNTDALIDRLAESATPVQRLKPAWIRAAGWLALGVPPLLAIAFIDGIRTYPRDFIGDGGRLIEVAAILATAATAAIAALAATVPGASRKWLLLPLLPLAIWLANIGKACFADWLRFGAGGLLLRVDGPCFPAMVAMSIVPTAAMLIMLRRGAPIHPRSTLALAALAIAALTNLGLRLIHGPDISITALVWSFATVAIIAIIAERRGAQVIGWPHLR